MSADNWAICPKCLHEAETASAQAREAVNAMYGTVSIAEFDRRRSELTDVDPEQYQTFREDYECVIDGGEAYVNYRGLCTVCRLKTEIIHTRTFWTSPTAGASA